MSNLNFYQLKNCRKEPHVDLENNSQTVGGTIYINCLKTICIYFIFRKVRFRDQRSNILDNDQWLDSDQARRNEEYQDLVSFFLSFLVILSYNRSFLLLGL